MGVRFSHAGPNKMNINQPSVWDSIEFDCIARDFDYLQYKQAHHDINCKGAAVSKAMYLSLTLGFFNEMALDYE